MQFLAQRPAFRTPPAREPCASGPAAHVHARVPQGQAPAFCSPPAREPFSSMPAAPQNFPLGWLPGRVPVNPASRPCRPKMDPDVGRRLCRGKICTLLDLAWPLRTDDTHKSRSVPTFCAAGRPVAFGAPARDARNPLEKFSNALGAVLAPAPGGKA